MPPLDLALNSFPTRWCLRPCCSPQRPPSWPEPPMGRAVLPRWSGHRLSGASRLSGAQLLPGVFWMHLTDCTEPPGRLQVSLAIAPRGWCRAKGRRWVSESAAVTHSGHNHLPVGFALTFLRRGVAVSPAAGAALSCAAVPASSHQPGGEAPARARCSPSLPPDKHLRAQHALRVASLCASPPFNSLACIIQKP